MRILFLGNNRVGLEALSFLRERGEEIVGLVLHPGEMRKCGEELAAASGLGVQHIFPAKGLRKPEILAAIRALKPDIAVSVFFGFILKPEFIELFPAGVVNLHPAYLPWNRGGYPNVWSIVEGTPAGATLHYIDAGVDTGDIILQQRVEVAPADTGESLYRKLEMACLEVFREGWPRVAAGNAPRIPQGGEAGTSHRDRDVESIDRIDLDSPTTARKLIDLLRARTFPPHPGAFIEVEGEKLYLRLQLLTEDQLRTDAQTTGEVNGGAKDVVAVRETNHV